MANNTQRKIRTLIARTCSSLSSIGTQLSLRLQKTFRIQMSKHAPIAKPSLDRLPLEIIWNISDYLDVDTRMLLGLTCKQLLFQVSSTKEWPTPEQYWVPSCELLQCLERDLPEYLLCRCCWKLYRWRQRAYANFTCSRDCLDECLEWCFDWCLGSYDKCDREATPGYGLELHRYVQRSVINLVYRAQEQGFSYGLPLSYLNTQCTWPGGVHQKMQARMLGSGNFIYKGYWQRILTAGNEVNELAELHSQAVCVHEARLSQQEDLRFWLSDTYSDAESKDAHKHKEGVHSHCWADSCRWCKTDWKLSVSCNPNGRSVATIGVWQSFPYPVDGWSPPPPKEGFTGCHNLEHDFNNAATGREWMWFRLQRLRRATSQYMRDWYTCFHWKYLEWKYRDSRLWGVPVSEL